MRTGTTFDLYEGYDKDKNAPRVLTVAIPYGNGEYTGGKEKLPLTTRLYGPSYKGQLFFSSKVKVCDNNNPHLPSIIGSNIDYILTPAFFTSSLEGSSPQQLIELIQIAFHQPLAHFSQLNPGYPIDHPNLYSFYHYNKFHHIFQNPERFILDDDGDMELEYTGIYENKFILSNWFGRIKAVVRAPKSNTYFIRHSNLTTRFRYFLQYKLLEQVSKRLDGDLKDNAFFSHIENDDVNARLNEIRDLNKITHNSEHAYHVPDRSYFNDVINFLDHTAVTPKPHNYSRFIFGQLNPFTRLYYGHASWDVSKAQTTRWRKIKHLFAMYSGFYHLQNYYLEYKVLFTDLFEELQAYSKQKRNLNDSINGIVDCFKIFFLAYTFGIFLAICFIEICTGLSGLVFYYTFLNTYWLFYLSLPLLMILFWADPDLDNNTTLASPAETLLGSSFYICFKAGFDAFMTVLSIGCLYVLTPMRWLRSILLYDLEAGTWHYKYQQDKDISNIRQFFNNLFYYGGYIDMGFTLLECIALSYAFSPFVPYVCMAFALVEAIALSIMVISVWLPLTYYKTCHNYRVMKYIFTGQTGLQSVQKPRNNMAATARENMSSFNFPSDTSTL